MKFRNYCVVIMGNTKGVLPEIENISQSQPNYMDAVGILIATFTSSVELNELTDWFKGNGRNFLLFDLSPNSSSCHITKKTIHDGLFGFLEKAGVKNLDLLSMDLLKTIKLTSDTKDDKATIRASVKPKRKIRKEDVEKMSKSDREEMINDIIDNGIENLTEEDKKLVKLLAK